MIRLRARLNGLPIFAALACAPALAADDLPAPSQRPGDILRIPGLPSIQLPPGARAFGPDGRQGQGPGVVDEDAPPPRARQDRGDGREPPRRAEKKPERIPPHDVPTEQSQRAGVLDRLFGQLKTSDDEEAAKGVAEAIQRVWLKSGSDTADLLMGRAVAAIAAKDFAAAEKMLDSILGIQPDWAEAWSKRAAVRFLRDDYDGAIADIDETLRREPRHFVALTGLGAILQKSDLDKRALEAYRRALDLYPEQPDVKKVVEKLRLEVEGRDI